MATSSRPRRSALYLPGNNTRALEKGKVLPADVVIFDLEDAVGIDDKRLSRERVCKAVASGDYAPREVVIRVNGLGSAWHDDDIAAVALSGADGVLVPKVESPEQVHELSAALDDAGAPSDLKLWVMMETPGAFLQAHLIASASERLSVLVVGTNDLANDLHALHRPGRMPLLTALSLAVLGARAADKVVLDGVFNSIKDDAGFVAEATQGREMGFDGKTVIHPTQISSANDIFGPSQDEVTYAQKVVSAFSRAEEAGESVIVLDGAMIESLHVRDAHRILELDAKIAELSAAGSLL